MKKKLDEPHLFVILLIILHWFLPSWIYIYVSNKLLFTLHFNQRFQPYIVGLTLGYILHTLRGSSRLQWNKMAVLWTWGVATVTGALVWHQCVHYDYATYLFQVVYGLVPYQRDSFQCYIGGDCKLSEVYYNHFNRFHSWVLWERIPL